PFPIITVSVSDCGWMSVTESFRLRMGKDGMDGMGWQKGRKSLILLHPSYCRFEYGPGESEVESPPPPPLPLTHPPSLDSSNGVRMRLTPSPKSSNLLTYHGPTRLNGAVMDSTRLSPPRISPPSPPTSLLSTSSLLLSSPSSIHPPPLPSYDQLTIRKSIDSAGVRFSRSTIRQASFKAAISNQRSSSSHCSHRMPSSPTPSCVSPSPGLVPSISSLPSFSSSIPTSFSTSITLNSRSSPESVDPSPSSSSSSTNSLTPPSRSIEKGDSMRRARPKSYVLATSCSFPVTGGVSPPPVVRNARYILSSSI
ncbi:hypothetical protein PMAYCL1PPCAC_12349, partial [Pristionchus mayeri]